LLSLVFSFLVVWAICTHEDLPRGAILAVLPTYTAFAAAWMCHRNLRSSIPLKIGGTFIWLLFGLQAAFLLDKLPCMVCTAVTLFIGAVTLAIRTRQHKIQPAGLVRFVIGYAGIAGFLLMCIAVVRVSINFRINSALNDVRRNGFPVTWRELDAYYPTPPAEKNAAGLYAAAFAKYAPGANDWPFVGDKALPPLGQPLPDSTKAAVALFIAENAEALKLLHAASRMTECRFPLDFAQGYGMNMPHLRLLRDGARMLELEALLKAEEGHPDEAAEAAKACIGVSRSLRNEPVLISQFVRMAIDSIGVMSVERVLSRAAVPEKQLADISAALETGEEKEGLVRALAGERCMAGELFNMELKYSLKPLKSAGIQEWDHLTVLRLTSELVSAAQGPLQAMRDRQREIEMEISKVPRLFVFTQMTLPTPSVLEKQLRRFALLRSGRAAIAVERFRMANGRLPDSLAELVPRWMNSAPADPFTDKPLLYRKLNKGFVVFSVGPDLKDLGGVEADPKNPQAISKVGFTVAR